MTFPSRHQSAKCQSCGSEGISIFYESDKVPITSPVEAPSREAARDLDLGRVHLGFCQACGFIENVVFDPSLIDYGQPWKMTQSCSPTFNAFAHDVAQRLIDSYDLHGKEIVEIGCGRGEFLLLLCQMGGNRGTGIDPASVPGHVHPEALERLRFIPEYFSEDHDLSSFDFVCCRHTLEHISPVGDFVASIRRSLGKCRDTAVFFQMPDVSRILQEVSFWEISYEHCSYFSLGSLARLFKRCGFELLRLEKVFGGRYCLIEARPSEDPPGPALAEEEDVETIARQVAHFTERVSGKFEQLKGKLKGLFDGGQRVVLWGADTKTGVFFNTLGIVDEIEVAVDINPLLHGLYIPGTGQKVMPPEFLKEYRPDVVIVMSPIYQDEIRGMLSRMNVTAELFSP